MRIKFFTFPFLLFIGLHTYAQQVRISIVDHQTREALPYASVFNKISQKGTLANAEGIAIIEANIQDTLEVMYLGYKNQKFVLNDIHFNVIELHPIVNELGEIVVVADDALLYQAIKNVKHQLQKQSKSSSKCFLQIETDNTKLPLELVQAFYNGYMDKGVITDLKFKNGRVGLIEDEGRYFVSLNTSKVISSFQLLNENSSFEDGIFCMSGKKVRKNYELRKIFDSNNSLQGISFTPRNNKKLWAGEVWFDEENHQPKKIVYEIQNTKKIPFFPIQPLDKMDNTNFKIELNYESNKLYLLNFKYSFQYFSKRELEYKLDTISTIASIQLFDKKLFYLPWLDNIIDFNDYRKISLLTWNKDFWKNVELPELTANQLSKINYFEEYGKILNFEPKDKRLRKNDDFFFEHNNVIWSPHDRWTLSSINKIDNNEFDKNNFAKSKYHIVVDIIFDVNEIDGKLKCSSVSIIDVFNSKWYLPNEVTYNRFLNIYFDLCEIERRRMQSQIDLLTMPSIKEIEKVYLNSYRNLQKILTQYRNEVDAGLQAHAMQKWNEFIKIELNVDNFKLLPTIDEK
jgi:hypothetical protein